MENRFPAKLGFTIDEFVAASGIGRTKVFEYIKLGQLKARKAGARTIITVEDGAAFISALPEKEAA